MNEIFKDIKGCEGVYQISNLGRVKGLSRTIIRSNGCPQSIKEKILKQSDCGRYLHIVLSINNIRTTKKIHRLVAIAFIPNPSNKEQVNHKDFNTTNNSIDNLEWVTPRENQTHSRKSKKTSSKYIGVHWNGHKWISQILINNKKITLGMFNTEIKAYKAYLYALKKYGLVNKYA